MFAYKKETALVVYYIMTAKKQRHFKIKSAMWTTPYAVNKVVWLCETPPEAATRRTRSSWRCNELYTGGKIIFNASHGRRVLMKINGWVSPSNKQEGQVSPSRVNVANGNLPNCIAGQNVHTQIAQHTPKVAGSSLQTADVTSSTITPQSFPVTSSSKWPHKREMHLIRHSIDRAGLQGHLHVFSWVGMKFCLHNAELWLSSTLSRSGGMSESLLYHAPLVILWKWLLK